MFNTYHSLTLLVLLKKKKKKKELLEKATIIKRFEYSPLGSEFKNQTDIAGKQNQMLHKSLCSKRENRNAHVLLNREETDAKTLAKILTTIIIIMLSIIIIIIIMIIIIIIIIIS